MRELLQTRVVAHTGQKVQFRFHPVMHLLDGDSFGAVCEMSQTFEESASFGPMSTAGSVSDPAKWLSDRLSEVASAAHQMDQRMRPIIVPSPMAALSHANTAIACDAAIRRTTLCQQEICLEFEDSAFAGCPNDVVRHVAHLRRHGFRVSVDMRKSWQTPIGEGLRLLIDSLRVDARDLEMNETLMEICEVASASGMLVIAENANWRDGEFLNRIGIHAGSKLRADS